MRSSLQQLVEGFILPRVRREDVRGFREALQVRTHQHPCQHPLPPPLLTPLVHVRGFREALQGSAALGEMLQAQAPALRAVHARFASRGGEHEILYDDEGGLGLTLARYTEMVWEAGLIGRQLSRNMAKAAFVNALNAGDALAGLGEFVEIVVRLAHHLTPMSREERVGAPPPPKKGALPAEPPPLPPPLLEAGAGGSLVFRAEAEAALLPKLEYILGKLLHVAFTPEEMELPEVRTFVARKSPFSKPAPPAAKKEPPKPPKRRSASGAKLRKGTDKMAPFLNA